MFFNRLNFRKIIFIFLTTQQISVLSLASDIPLPPLPPAPPAPLAPPAPKVRNANEEEQNKIIQLKEKIQLKNAELLLKFKSLNFEEKLKNKDFNFSVLLGTKRKIYLDFMKLDQVDHWMSMLQNDLMKNLSNSKDVKSLQYLVQKIDRLTLLLTHMSGFEKIIQERGNLLQGTHDQNDREALFNFTGPIQDELKKLAKTDLINLKQVLSQNKEQLKSLDKVQSSLKSLYARYQYLGNNVNISELKNEMLERKKLIQEQLNILKEKLTHDEDYILSRDQDQVPLCLAEKYLEQFTLDLSKISEDEQQLESLLNELMQIEKSVVVIIYGSQKMSLDLSKLSELMNLVDREIYHRNEEIPRLKLELQTNFGPKMEKELKIIDELFTYGTLNSSSDHNGGDEETLKLKNEHLNALKLKVRMRLLNDVGNWFENNIRF